MRLVLIAALVLGQGLGNEPGLMRERRAETELRQGPRFDWWDLGDEMRK